MTYLLVVIGSLLGSLSQGLSGIGFAVIYISICNFVLPYVENLTSMKLIITLVNFPFIIRLFKKIRWKYLMVPFLFSFFGNWFAMVLLNRLNEVLLKVILGAILSSFGLYNLVCKKDYHFNGGIVSGAIVGILVGFFSGFCGMAGPVLALYYLGIKDLTDDKDCYYATTVTMFQVVGIYQFVVYFATDFIPAVSWEYALFGIVPAFIGMIVGRRNFKKIDTASIKLFLNIFMVVMGAFLTITNVVML